MNEILQNIQDRHSTRAFKPDAVPMELIEQIMEAGEYAASGKGMQSSKIIAVLNPELRDQMAADNCMIGGWKEGFDPYYGAPVILAVVVDKSAPTYVYDGSLSLGNMMLAAQSLGLGTCWIHRAKQMFEMPVYKDLLKDSCEFDGDYEGIGFLALGWPQSDEIPERPRKEHRTMILE